MPSTPQVYREIELGELLPEVQKYKSAGWRFVQLCATTIEGGVEILYTFAKGSGSEVENLLLKVQNGTHVPSITGFYGAAFVFENEMHDLFAVLVDGISIDFKGNFYRVAVGAPMNPEAAKYLEEELAPGMELVEELTDDKTVDLEKKPAEEATENAPKEGGEEA